MKTLDIDRSIADIKWEDSQIEDSLAFVLRDVRMVHYWWALWEWRNLTWSCTMVEVEYFWKTLKVVIDMGMNQWLSDELEESLNRIIPFNPEEIDFLVITHPHMDHTWLLPLLWRYEREKWVDLKMQILTSKETREIQTIALIDSAKILARKYRLDWIENERKKIMDFLRTVKKMWIDLSEYVDSNWNINFSWIKNKKLSELWKTIKQPDSDIIDKTWTIKKIVADVKYLLSLWIHDKNWLNNYRKKLDWEMKGISLILRLFEEFFMWMTPRDIINSWHTEELIENILGSMWIDFDYKSRMEWFISSLRVIIESWLKNEKDINEQILDEDLRRAIVRDFRLIKFDKSRIKAILDDYELIVNEGDKIIKILKFMNENSLFSKDSIRNSELLTQMESEKLCISSVIWECSMELSDSYQHKSFYLRWLKFFNNKFWQIWLANIIKMLEEWEDLTKYSLAYNIVVRKWHILDSIVDLLDKIKEVRGYSIEINRRNEISDENTDKEDKKNEELEILIRSEEEYMGYKRILSRYSENRSRILALTNWLSWIDLWRLPRQKSELINFLIQNTEMLFDIDSLVELILWINASWINYEDMSEENIERLIKANELEIYKKIEMLHEFNLIFQSIWISAKQLINWEISEEKIVGILWYVPEDSSITIFEIVKKVIENRWDYIFDLDKDSKAVISELKKLKKSWYTLAELDQMVRLYNRSKPNNLVRDIACLYNDLGLDNFNSLFDLLSDRQLLNNSMKISSMCFVDEWARELLEFIYTISEVDEKVLSEIKNRLSEARKLIKYLKKEYKKFSWFNTRRPDIDKNSIKKSSLSESVDPSENRINVNEFVCKEFLWFRTMNFTHFNNEFLELKSISFDWKIRLSETFDSQTKTIISIQKEINSFMNTFDRWLYLKCIEEISEQKSKLSNMILDEDGSNKKIIADEISSFLEKLLEYKNELNPLNNWLFDELINQYRSILQLLETSDSSYMINAEINKANRVIFSLNESMKKWYMKVKKLNQLHNNLNLLKSKIDRIWELWFSDLRDFDEQERYYRWIVRDINRVKEYLWGVNLSDFKTKPAQNQIDEIVDALEKKHWIVNSLDSKALEIRSLIKKYLNWQSTIQEKNFLFNIFWTIKKRKLQKLYDNTDLIKKYLLSKKISLDSFEKKSNVINWIIWKLEGTGFPLNLLSNIDSFLDYFPMINSRIWKLRKIFKMYGINLYNDEEISKYSRNYRLLKSKIWRKWKVRDINQETNRIVEIAENVSWLTVNYLRKKLNETIDHINSTVRIKESIQSNFPLINLDYVMKEISEEWWYKSDEEIKDFLRGYISSLYWNNEEFIRNVESLLWILAEIDSIWISSESRFDRIKDRISSFEKLRNDINKVLWIDNLTVDMLLWMNISELISISQKESWIVHNLDLYVQYIIEISKLLLERWLGSVLDFPDYQESIKKTISELWSSMDYIKRITWLLPWQLQSRWDIHKIILHIVHNKKSNNAKRALKEIDRYFTIEQEIQSLLDWMEYLLKKWIVDQKTADEYIKNQESKVPYTREDVLHILSKIRTLKMWQTVEEWPLSFTLINSGHWLWSSQVVLQIDDWKWWKVKWLFTWDFWRFKDDFPAWMPSTDYPEKNDFAVVENTYWWRNHENFEIVTERFVSYINKICVQNWWKLLIPVFQYERAQQVLIFLQELKKRKLIPDIPIFLDWWSVEDINNVYFRSKWKYSNLWKMKFAYINGKKWRKNFLDSWKSWIVLATGWMLQDWSTASNYLRMPWLLDNAKSWIAFVWYQSKWTLWWAILALKWLIDLNQEDEGLIDPMLLLNPIACDVDRFSFSGHWDQSDIVNLVSNLNFANWWKLFLNHWDPSAIESSHEEIVRNWAVSSFTTIIESSVNEVYSLLSES